MSRRRVKWGRANPSYTGTICVTPSPESTTTPVVRPVSPINNNPDTEQSRTLRIQCKDSLNSNIYPTKPILLKHNLTHPDPILLRIHGGFSQQHLPPPRIHSQLLIKSIIPQMLHIFPVAHNTVLHRLGHL